MIRRPPRSTRRLTLFPYTTLFRSLWALWHAGLELWAYWRGLERDYSRTRPAQTLVAMAVTFGIAFVVIPENRLWNARLLPFYYLMVLFLAATALADVTAPIARALPRVGSVLWR